MKEFGVKSEKANLAEIGLERVACAYWNLTVPELVEETILRGQGVLTDTGALACDTGEFTGRSPKDKYIVKDSNTEKKVWWSEVNTPFNSNDFDALYNRVTAYLGGKEVFIRDAYACASPEYKLNIRIVTEYPWQNLFANNLFLRPSRDEILNFKHDWLIIAAPEFYAKHNIDGTRQHNFTIINFTRKIILIGGSAYTGEIKKAIFTVLNYLLPTKNNALPMHCSANIGEKGDTTIFFGLSGTGKTTLSADPNRKLIGDDEHGWDEKSVFNFEGGCYAKCVDLTIEKEPQIFSAIKFGTLLENINFFEGSNTVDYKNTAKTENTRAAYPIEYIDNAASPSVGGIPKNIFFLTCDAFGVLPPISKLTTGQAMYHFISGYTAKVAGTEAGITEPQITFSACFGKPFLPLHPTHYAQMLGEKLTECKANVWLINTGWSGGSYGVGERIKLSYTRAIITAALNGEFENALYITHPVFGLQMPSACPEVPELILNPKNTWKDKKKYDETANNLAAQFIKNFATYKEFATEEILAGAPKPAEKEKTVL